MEYFIVCDCAFRWVQIKNILIYRNSEILELRRTVIGSEYQG